MSGGVDDHPAAAGVRKQELTTEIKQTQFSFVWFSLLVSSFYRPHQCAVFFGYDNVTD